LIEGDFRITATELDAMLRLNLIHRSGVEAQNIEGIVELMGGARCGERRLRCCEAEQYEKGCCEPHLESVVILGAVEQGKCLQDLLIPGMRDFALD
ncbi:MAG TPA: hypothetical protein VII37_05690, partial [Candidatus Acidoferrum sp.]